MDVDALSWMRKGKLTNLVTHEVFESWSMQNGTDSWTLSKNDSAPGGWACRRQAVDPSSDDMPFSMISIDDEAADTGAETLDGVSAETWSFRRADIPLTNRGDAAAAT